MNLKNKWCYYGIIGMLVLSCALLLYSVGVRAANGGELTDEVDHTETAFEDLAYFEDVTEEEFDDLTARLEAAVTDTANADQVDALIDEMEDMARRMMANDVIANIYATLDAENQDYNDLVTYYEDLAVDLNDKIQQTYRMIAESECSEVLHARVEDEEEWQDILEYEPMTDEQKELVSRETELSLKYDELYIADYTVTIKGTDYDMDTITEGYEAGKITVEEYFTGFSDLLSQRNQAMGELFLELVEVRTQIAQSYGYDNYADYAYAEIYDRDYTPEDLEEYRRQVIEYIVPLEHDLYDMLMGDASFDAMWDAEMSEQECLDNLERYLPEISDDMLISYRYMVDHGMCDLSIDERKAPGGYTTQIYVYNAPFMFNCADGTISDMGTLIHEFGHYNQMYFASEDEWLYSYNNLDVAEIHSQGLELLFLDYSEDIYGENAYAVQLYTLMNMAYACVEGVKEDAFQYAVYSNPEGLTVEKLNEIYYDCCEEYGALDFNNSYYLGMYGFMASDEISEWVEIPHTFQSPLYYVSYSVSMAAVEELWDVILDDREEGIDVYLDLVERGLVDSYTDVLQDVGLNNPIENPRFEVYADNTRYYLELQDSRGSAEEAGSGEVVQDPEEDQENAPAAEEQEEDDRDSDRDREDDNDRDRDQKEGPNTLLIILLVVGVVVLLVIIIVIIVLVSSDKKAKKQAVGQNTPLNPQIPTPSMSSMSSATPSTGALPTQDVTSQISGIPPVPPIPSVPEMPAISPQQAGLPSQQAKLQEQAPQDAPAEPQDTMEAQVAESKNVPDGQTPEHKENGAGQDTEQ